MRGPALAGLVAGVLAAGCGDSPPAATTPPGDVQGTPFLAVERKELPPEAATIGDTDAERPADAPPVAVAIPIPSAPPAAEAEGDAAYVTFDDLAGFECAAYASDAKEDRPIPEKIRALSGRTVVVDGYMMPLQYEAGGAKKFLLMRYKFGCCYAIAPKLNEWIEVTMEGAAVADYIPDVTASVWGVLDVKTELRDGAAVGLYRMRATRSEFTEAK